MNRREIASFQRRVVSWYAMNGRDLPWRKTRDPYRIWVSEVMLQQTQVSRVKEYYPRFIKKFPTVLTLAAAPWRSILPVWRGLGYYHRAQNMAQAARLIVREHRGVFPEELSALRKLPGVGPYTAAAIAAFAFRQPVIALDTNLRRVLARYFLTDAKGVEKYLSPLAQLARSRSADLTQGLMDLGALICDARRPKCSSCPLRRGCRAHRSGRVNEVRRRRPQQGEREQEPTIDVGVACIHRNGKYLIAKRRGSRGTNWEFAGGKREAGESLRACLKREIKEELGVEISVRPPFLISESHSSKGRWRLHFCRCQILRGSPRAIEHSRLKWISAESLLKHPFPEANRVAVERLVKMR